MPAIFPMWSGRKRENEAFYRVCSCHRPPAVDSTAGCTRISQIGQIGQISLVTDDHRVSLTRLSTVFFAYVIVCCMYVYQYCIYCIIYIYCKHIGFKWHLYSIKECLVLYYWTFYIRRSSQPCASVYLRSLGLYLAHGCRAVTV